MRWLIGVMTCHKNYDKAEAQRQTWVKDVRALGFADVVFFLGEPIKLSDRMPKSDEVWLPVDDSYLGLTKKIQAMCAWSAARGYDYHSKCDDDVYAVPTRLRALSIEGYDYSGRFRGPHGNYPSSFASGFFYTLSQRADELVARSIWNGDWLEERFVANRLAMEGIFGYNDPVSYKVCGPTVSAKEILKRKTLADGTVFCEYTAHQQAELHALLRHLPPVTGHPGLRQVPKVNITQAQFDAAPTDKPPVHKIEKYLRKI